MGRHGMHCPSSLLLHAHQGGIYAHHCMYGTTRTQPHCDSGLLTARVESGAAVMTTLHTYNAFKYPRGSACAVCKYTVSHSHWWWNEELVWQSSFHPAPRARLFRPVKSLPCCFCGIAAHVSNTHSLSLHVLVLKTRSTCRELHEHVQRAAALGQILSCSIFPCPAVLHGLSA